MYVQMINICSTVQEEMVENGRTRQERQECGITLRGFQHDDKESKQANKEAEQTAVIPRLSEEIIQTSQQTKEKRSCLETSRRAREECSPEQQNIDACVNAFAFASADHTAAVEHHTAMKAAQRV